MFNTLCHLAGEILAPYMNTASAGHQNVGRKENGKVALQKSFIVGLFQDKAARPSAAMSGI